MLVAILIVLIAPACLRSSPSCIQEDFVRAPVVDKEHGVGAGHMRHA